MINPGVVQKILRIFKIPSVKNAAIPSHLPVRYDFIEMKTAFFLSAILGLCLFLIGCAAQDEVETTSAPSRGGESGAISGPSGLGETHSGVGNGGQAVGAAASGLAQPGH